MCLTDNPSSHNLSEEPARFRRASFSQDRDRGFTRELTFPFGDIQQTPRQNLDAMFRGIADSRLTYLSTGANSICYRAILREEDGAERDVIVKKALLDGTRTNPDTTFVREAHLLGLLRQINIQDVPALIGRFQYRNRYYLLVGFVPGCHPDAVYNPFLPDHLSDLFQKLARLDSAGFIHYDLQIPNILLNGNRVGIIDFEFGEQVDPTENYREDKEVFCEDYNVSSNPYFPIRSSLSNFEFRSLYGYLQKLCSDVSKDAARHFLFQYLACRRFYHHAFRNDLEVLRDNGADLVSRQSKRPLLEVLDLLDGAIAYEQILSRLYINPSPQIATCEYLIMKYRYCLFNRDFNDRSVNMDPLYESSLRQISVFAQNSRTAGELEQTEYFLNMIGTLRKLRVKEFKGRTPSADHPTRVEERKGRIV
jgi:tRNA A-37 threonylcarbamoyl transferase component Bud32